jgi:hypothetical protein
MLYPQGDAISLFSTFIYRLMKQGALWFIRDYFGRGLQPNPKFEVRNPKSETNSNNTITEIQNEL